MKAIIHTCVFAILVSLVSCEIVPVKSRILSSLNRNTTLKEAKEEFAPILDENFIYTDTIDGSVFTSLTLFRKTHVRTTSNQNRNSYRANTYSSFGTNYTTTTAQTRTNSILTPFYLVFKNDSLYFMGFMYEAKNHPNTSELIKIIGE